MRHINMESHYEYGSRVGFWRVLRLFAERRLPLTAFAVGMAIERNPAAAEALLRAGHEIATHGYRWIDYQYVPETREREDMQRAIAVQTRITGSRPLGWYLGRCSPNTRRLVVEEGGFVYDSDSYSDELPYYDTSCARPQLIIPYSLETNDMRFVAAQGFNTGEQFFTYLKDSFDQLYVEGATSPAMLSVGLHARIVGRPGRAAALARFLDYITAQPDVWVCRRIDIARHWLSITAPTG
jgi:peptidoglycan/xylan/chitin deacetylase (PgdA/CDA1 family)